MSLRNPFSEDRRYPVLPPPLHRGGFRWSEEGGFLRVGLGHSGGESCLPRVKTPVRATSADISDDVTEEFRDTLQGWGVSGRDGWG